MRLPSKGLDIGGASYRKRKNRKKRIKKNGTSLKLGTYRRTLQMGRYKLRINGKNAHLRPPFACLIQQNIYRSRRRPFGTSGDIFYPDRKGIGGKRKVQGTFRKMLITVTEARGHMRAIVSRSADSIIFHEARDDVGGGEREGRGRGWRRRVTAGGGRKRGRERSFLCGPLSPWGLKIPYDFNAPRKRSRSSAR